MIQIQDQRFAAIYARVSGEQQAKDGTIASQVSALRQRVEADGLALMESMCFIDEGYSGGTLVRPALERLRDEAASGAVGRVYVLAPDRLARDFVDQMVLVDEFRRAEAELVFLNRALGDSPEDQLLLQVQGAMAQYERQKILERCRRGRLHAARSGSLAVLGRGSYGYRYVCKADGGGAAALNVALEEAAVVRQVFHWVGCERVSLNEVCRRLMKQGVCSPRGHARWDRSTLWQMLKNPLYKGQAAYGKTRAVERNAPLRVARGQERGPRRVKVSRAVGREQWITIPAPALVSEELFDAVGEQLEENAKRQREQRAGARYLLQGLMVCRCCRYAMIGRRQRTYEYYRCSGSNPANRRGERCCWNTPLRCDLMEEAVWSDVAALLREPARIEQEYRRRLEREEQSPGRQHGHAAQLSQMQRSIERLIDAYQDGLLEKDDFETRVKTARARLAALQEQERSEAQKKSEETQLRLVIGRVEEFAAKVASGLATSDWATRREIIRSLVKEIEVDHEQVRIVYKVSPSPFELAPLRGSCQDCLRRSFAPPGLRATSHRLSTSHA